jgi:hypothetical protein
MPYDGVKPYKNSTKKSLRVKDAVFDWESRRWVACEDDTHAPSAIEDNTEEAKENVEEIEDHTTEIGDHSEEFGNGTQLQNDSDEEPESPERALSTPDLARFVEIRKSTSTKLQQIIAQLDELFAELRAIDDPSPSLMSTPGVKAITTQIAEMKLIVRFVNYLLGLSLMEQREVVQAE